VFLQSLKRRGILKVKEKKTIIEKKDKLLAVALLRK